MSSEVARCPNCSSSVKAHDAYCENCGLKLVGVAAPEDQEGMMIRSLEEENQDLRGRLRRATRRPSRIVGFGLTGLGLTSLSLSIFFESSILAFIGLGLTFWGALLLFVRTTLYVKGQLLESTARPYYASIERLLDHLGYEGVPVYLPPKQLKALKGGTIFMAAEKDEGIDYDRLSDELQIGQLFTPDPSGIFLTAPGVGLANLLEEEMGKDFTKMSLEDLQRDLPPAIVEGFELAEGVEVEVEGEAVTVKVTNSLFEAFNEKADERLKRIGCPLVSAMALALTRATGKPIIVEDVRSETGGGAMRVRYLMLRGDGR